MKKSIKKSLTLLAALGIVSTHAGSISFTTYLVDDGNPGAGAPYDRLDVPWTEFLTFNQFNMPGQQLDSAKISYSLYLELTQSVRNTATRNDNVAKNFKLNNELEGGLSLGSLTLFNFDGGSQLNTATVPKNQTKDFDPFILDQSSFITLTGADLAPFIGTGTFTLTSYANAITTPIATPANNFSITTHSEGNSKVGVEYFYSAIPANHQNVPEGGNTMALFGMGSLGLIGLARTRRQQTTA